MKLYIPMTLSTSDIGVLILKTNLIGNVLLPEKIDAAIALGRELDIYSRMANDPVMIPSTQFYIGIDAGFGTSVLFNLYHYPSTPI